MPLKVSLSSACSSLNHQSHLQLGANSAITSDILVLKLPRMQYCSTAPSWDHISNQHWILIVAVSKICCVAKSLYRHGGRSQLATDTQATVGAGSRVEEFDWK